MRYSIGNRKGERIILQTTNIPNPEHQDDLKAERKGLCCRSSEIDLGSAVLGHILQRGSVVTFQRLATLQLRDPSRFHSGFRGLGFTVRVRVLYGSLRIKRVPAIRAYYRVPHPDYDILYYTPKTLFTPFSPR